MLKEFLCRNGIIPAKGYRIESDDEVIKRLQKNGSINTLNDVSPKVIKLKQNQIAVINIYGFKIRLSDDFYQDNPYAANASP